MLVSSELVSNSQSFLIILSFGFFVAFKSASGADECYFDKKGVSYCQYGCCEDGCCHMTTGAIIGLVAGAVVGLASIIGCLICLSCMLKRQTTIYKSAVMIHPIHSNTDDAYINNNISEHEVNYGQYNLYTESRPFSCKSNDDSGHSSSSSTSSTSSPPSKIQELNSKSPRYDPGSCREKY